MSDQIEVEVEREASLGETCGTCGQPANEVADHVVDGVVYHAQCIPDDWS